MNTQKCVCKYIQANIQTHHVWHTQIDMYIDSHRHASSHIDIQRHIGILTYIYPQMPTGMGTDVQTRVHKETY